MNGSHNDTAEGLRERADSGDPAAMMDLGIAFRDGLLGLPKDMRKARRLFLESADAGNPLALVCAGDLEYEQGRRSKAADHYLQASALHVPEAESRLVSAYLGLGENAFALDHAERGAVMGREDCMLVLGRMYMNGTDVEEDHMHALYWFSRCCRRYPEAMRNVGIIRMEKGTPYFDMYKGLAALRLAADSRDEEARRLLLELRLDADTDGLPEDYFDPPDVPQYTEPVIERMAAESPRVQKKGMFSRLIGR